MGTPAGPLAYAHCSLDVWADGTVYLNANGCLMNPDGSLQLVGGSYQFTVEIPLTYGMTAAAAQAAISDALVSGYGIAAPSSVVLVEALG
jgi:hypothetical protein